MGVDLLDITFRIEKSFGIRMTFDEWLTIAGVTGETVEPGIDFTVQQVFDHILDRLDESPSGYGPPQVSREVLLETLSRFFDVPIEDLSLNTELDGLLSSADRAEKWSELSRCFKLRLPPLRRSTWLTVLIALPVLATPVVVFGLLRTWDFCVGGLLSVVATGTVWGTVLHMTAGRAVVLPRQCRTVQGLKGLLNGSAHKADMDQPGNWSREDVWGRLQEILVDCLGVDAGEVTPEARLIGDLGAE